MTDDAGILPGSRVVMHYTLALTDGTIVETTRDGEPIDFHIGDGTLIEGLELAILGLQPGQTQSLRIDPREGFGYPDPASLHDIPRAEFDPGVDLAIGMIIGFSLPSGEEIPGTVIGLEGDLVRVDFNHPLAGREFVFDVEILAVEAAEPPA